MRVGTARHGAAIESARVLSMAVLPTSSLRRAVGVSPPVLTITIGYRPTDAGCSPCVCVAATTIPGWI